jgi:hypothetical protein
MQLCGIKTLSSSQKYSSLFYTRNNDNEKKGFTTWKQDWRAVLNTHQSLKFDGFSSLQT